MSSTEIAGWIVIALFLFAMAMLVVWSNYFVTISVDNSVRNLDSATQVRDEADLAVCMRIA